jgi:flagellar biosynthesis/type III secretory pathway protein FliH
MSEPDDAEDFGLRAFEDLKNTVQKSNKAYSDVAGKLPALAKQLEALDTKSTKAAQRVEDAAQAVTSYIKTDRRTLLISCGFGAIALVFCAAFLGDIKGSRTGYAQGFAEGQQETKKRDLLAEWAVSSPSGRMAYEMDRVGQIQAFGMCKIEGYKIRTDQKGTWCVSVSGNGLIWPVARP